MDRRLLTGTAGITAVWLVRTPGTNPTGTHFLPGSTNPHAIEWVVYLTMIFAAMVSMIWLPRKSYFRLPVGVVVAAVLAWMIASNTNHVYWLLVFTVLAAAGWVIDNQSTSWSWKYRLPLAWFAAAILIYPIFVLARQAPTPVLTSEVSESASFEPEAAKSKIHADVADWSVIGIVLIATGSTGMMLYFAPRRVIPYAAAAWIAAALLSCMPVFNTSSGWFFWGFAYGTHHYEKMASGENNNLAELLKTQWNWDDLMAPAISLPKGQLSDSIGSFLTTVDPGVKLVELTTPDGGIGLPLKYLLVTVWVVSVILCSIGAAMHDRNRSPRFLAAIATPWIMFFAVMVQMHQRYLLWGASLTAATAVLSPGYALLHIFLSIVAMSQEMKSMLDDGRYQNNPVDQFIQNWHPGITWAMLLTAGIFLYTSLKWEKSPAKALAKE